MSVTNENLPHVRYGYPIKEIPEDCPKWCTHYWVNDTYPFDVHTTRHHPDVDEDMGCSNSTFIGKDATRAEILSLVKTKEFLEGELPLLSEINNRLIRLQEIYPEKFI